MLAVMLQALAARVADPDRTILHRALRVAIVQPPLVWAGLSLLHDAQFALVAAFGSFAALAMADFMGPRASRLLAHLVLAVLGTLLVALGTALSNTLWPAVIAMLVIGVAAQFVMALGGQFALGNNAGVLSFVVAVMVPAPDDAIGSRVAGWLAAMACSAVAATLLWPRHERRDLYLRLREACTALAALVRAAADGGHSGGRVAEAIEAVDRVREVQRSLGFRPIGPPGHQRALLGLVDAMSQALRFSRVLSSEGQSSAADRDLARAAAATLEAVASVMQVCAEGRANFAAPGAEALVKARHGHLARLDANAARALASGVSGADVVAAIADVFPVRVLSYLVLGMTVDALVIAGRPVRIHDDFAIAEPTEATGTIQHWADILLPHLSTRSVWMHNCLRAGLALALAVLVAKLTDIGHAFWVVLATLSVLRSNAITTGATVLSAIAGTFAGFVLATLAMWLLGSNQALLWITLPLVAFLAGYAPYAISFGAGQAMFALLVVELFNIMAPEGWEVGEARLTAVAVGALVALSASLIMWPKGASAALREELAAHVRVAGRLVAGAFDMIVGRATPAHVDASLGEAAAARHRADEAFAAYLGERGAKRVPLATWGWLFRVPIVMRGAAEALIAMHRSGFAAVQTGNAAQRFDDAVRAVAAAYDDLAARLADPHRAKDARLLETITDLDMVGGSGLRRDAILEAAAAYVESHRGDPSTVTRVTAIVWGVGWLAYLAHVRAASEEPLDEVAAGADVPWWR